MEEGRERVEYAKVHTYIAKEKLEEHPGSVHIDLDGGPNSHCLINELTNFLTH
jgi:hypothetical protein